MSQKNCAANERTFPNFQQSMKVWFQLQKLALFNVLEWLLNFLKIMRKGEISPLAPLTAARKFSFNGHASNQNENN